MNPQPVGAAVANAVVGSVAEGRRAGDDLGQRGVGMRRLPIEAG
ncbi:MAG: hypothetical protein AAF909_07835 [Pseudomonadota bacterium]